MTPYELDDETQEAVEMVFGWAQELVDLQKDEDVHEDMMAIIVDAATRLGIPQNKVHIEETEEVDGSINLKITVEPVEEEPKRPNLKLIKSDDDDGTIH